VSRFPFEADGGDVSDKLIKVSWVGVIADMEAEEENFEEADIRT